MKSEPPSNPLDRGMFDVVWQRQVPLKVSVFSWRLIRDRLPTKDNLLHKGILHQDEYISCIGGCGLPETAMHLLFCCDIFGIVWHHLYQGVGISIIAPASVGDHLQFGQLPGLLRFTHPFLTVI